MKSLRDLRRARKRYQRAWRAKNPSYSREYAIEWYHDNKDEVNARRRERRLIKKENGNETDIKTQNDAACGLVKSI